MGLKVNQPIGTSNQGQLENFYVRIENVVLERPEKKLTIIVAAYPSPDDAKISSPIYDDLVNPNFSGIIGVSIIYKGECINYPVMIQKEIDDLSPILDLYKYSYELVKQEFGKIFGEENISNEF